tara:strand:+ start:15519 stop:16196 length:678 start_codon:yes stop_codon:yes gene_type:complete
MRAITIIIFFTLICKNLIAEEYNYEISSLNVTFATISLNLNKSYAAVDIQSKGLIGFFYKFQSTAYTSYNENISKYKYSRSKKNFNKKLNATFMGKDARINFENIKPKRGYKKINISDLIKVIDPLSALTEILKKGFNDCNFSKKVFDGEDVYILKLVDANLTRNEHKLCTLYYKTISGHKIKREKKLNNIKINIFYPVYSKDISKIYFETKVNKIPMKMISTTK